MTFYTRHPEGEKPEGSSYFSKKTSQKNKIAVFEKKMPNISGNLQFLPQNPFYEKKVAEMRFYSKLK
jgi:hypothetical protein